ncbi:MAG: hypothetical protein KC776_14100 [Myxococcales bacterium]|nr:hypothetical protein [Myxococcales bacterium]MCB9579785.1 hypothetical protein [Polyangiaceae bacterium]
MTEKRTIKSLVQEERGAIMVAGAFMAFFLAGALFYLIGTGNAIMYRERVQDASDAIAFSAAGVHARGMNMIVLINLIMAAILAVLVALRMIALMLGIALAACAIIVALSFGTGAAFCGPFMTWGGNLESKIIQASNKYANVVDKVLPVLSKMEVVVAITTPYVALAKSFDVADHYKGDTETAVNSGFMVSPSMVPWLPDGKKLGLPVQEMDYDKFCKKAAEIGVDLAFFWMPGFAVKALKWAAGGLAGTFSGYFCGQSGGASDVKSTMKNDLASTIKTICDNKKKQWDKDHEGESDPPSFKYDDCKKDTQKDLNKQVDSTVGQASQGIDAGSGKIFDMKNKTPKEVWEGAKIGSVWFATWGVAFGNEEWPRKMDKGVAVAASSGMPNPNTSWGNFRFAQAEFYWDKSGKWEDNKDDAMWEMRWRARLRRVGLNGLNLGEYFSKFGLGKLMEKFKVKDKVMENLNKTGTLQHLFGGFVFDKAEDWLKGAISKPGAKLDKWIDDKLKFTSWEIIH